MTRDRHPWSPLRDMYTNLVMADVFVCGLFSILCLLRRPVENNRSFRHVNLHGTSTRRFSVPKQHYDDDQVCQVHNLAVHTLRYSYLCCNGTSCHRPPEHLIPWDSVLLQPKLCDQGVPLQAFLAAGPRGLHHASSYLRSFKLSWGLVLAGLCLITLPPLPSVAEETFIRFRFAG